MLRIISRQLTKLEVDNFQCSDNDHEALRLIANRNNPTKVVVTDLNMSGMDGLQPLRKLGNVEFSVSVILISEDNHLVGLEALARWRHSDKGPISPITFIRTAEKKRHDCRTQQ